MKSIITGAMCGLAAQAAALAVGAYPNKTQLRNIMYFDQYHTTTLPPRDVTAGITHVIMAFAASSDLVPETAQPYKPFKPLDEVRALFDEGIQVGIAIGGWGDNDGFDIASKSDKSREAWAKNVAKLVEDNGFDFVDIDWEYPAGNGADYKQVPNSKKTYQIEAFPKLLKAVKKAIAPKPLSIAVAGLKRDMIAFYGNPSPQEIWDTVDFVNVMTYDLINRRDTATQHHTSVRGSLASVDRYLALGLPASKANLGFAFYAKYFETKPGENCKDRPVGCPIVQAENADGSDAGTSGTVTFEKANYAPPQTPTNLTVSPDGSCGPGTSFTCQGVQNQTFCCSQYGFCGSEQAYCGAGCQRAYGRCEGPDTSASFLKAVKDPLIDEVEGGAWYWDAEAELFWTWDTPELIARKFHEIVAARGLGGVMAWSLAEDSYDWSHIRAISEGVESLQ